MRYDQQSAYVFTVTDWASLGAIFDPPDDLPRFGAPLTPEETAALGSARLAAESTRTGSASETFVQPHPQHATRGIVLICTAWVDRSGGWSIGLIEPTGQESPWVLKADSQAVLRCACHCDWNRSCPGVVSDPHAPPPAARPMFAPPSWPSGPQGAPSHVPAPPAIPSAPTYATDHREAASMTAEPKRQGFLSAVLFGPRRAPDRVATPEPSPSYPAAAYVAAGAAAPAIASYSGYAGAPGQAVDHHWPAEEYRGPIYGQAEPHVADALIERAWQSEALPSPELEIPVARAERRGFWGGMFGRREEPSPPAVEHQHPTALDYAPPPEVQFLRGNAPSPSDDPGFYHLTSEEYAAIPSVDYGQGDPEPQPLSSQAEIDAFIAQASSYDAPADPAPAYDDAPAYEPEPISYDDAPLALPAPEEEER